MDFTQILGWLTTAADWIEVNIIGLLGQGFGILVRGVDLIPILAGLFDIFGLFFGA